MHQVPRVHIAGRGYRPVRDLLKIQVWMIFFGRWAVVVICYQLAGAVIGEFPNIFDTTHTARQSGAVQVDKPIDIRGVKHAFHKQHLICQGDIEICQWLGHGRIFFQFAAAVEDQGTTRSSPLCSGESLAPSQSDQPNLGKTATSKALSNFRTRPTLQRLIF